MYHDQLYADRPNEHPPDLPGEPIVGPGVQAEVGRMGTSIELLLHPLFRAYLSSRDFTNRYFPKTTPGFVFWSAANKFLREVHAPMGWTQKDEDGVAKVIAPDGSFSITAVGGNSDTGLFHRIPSTRRPRGEAGKRDIFDNRQGDLFRVGPPAPVKKTWYLLSYQVNHGDAAFLRVELSLPWAFNGKGEVVQWYKRLILPSIDLREGPPRLRNEEGPSKGPEIDVAVNKKVAH